MLRSVFFLVCALPVLAQDPVLSPWDLLRAEHDKNGDGRITAEEYTRGKDRFERLDQDKDGVLTEEDWGGGRQGRRRRGGGRRAGMPERGEGPKTGTDAPDFTLPTKADPKKTETLSSYRKKKPVALIFGSYT